MPAEFTRIYSGESKADSAASKRDFTCVGSDTSALKEIARGDSDWELELISETTRSAWVELEL
ncbi:hypothetical protein Ccrd_007360 [Cynara cardunculus var. scolymus]|uniref:Uncharacterized protein n=1 Tax=Cynara cardunculus var. scolymus TaxID=59895 RepID=A0A103XH61_CYNCS|nr:hypothetical protein Ccrd_007360 [Cynara cardunculus var. scolymus]